MPMQIEASSARLACDLVQTHASAWFAPVPVQQRPRLCSCTCRCDASAAVNDDCQRAVAPGRLCTCILRGWRCRARQPVNEAHQAQQCCRAGSAFMDHCHLTLRTSSCTSAPCMMGPFLMAVHVHFEPMPWHVTCQVTTSMQQP